MNRTTGTELDKIITIGCGMIDQAIESVIAKYDEPEIIDIPQEYNEIQISSPIRRHSGNGIKINSNLKITITGNTVVSRRSDYGIRV